MAFSFVSAVNFAASGATSGATGAMNLASGNHVAVFAKWEDAARTPTCSDTAVNAYQSLTVRNISGSVYGRLFYVLNATGNASNVITVNWTSFTSLTKIIAMQFSAGGTVTFVSENFGPTASGTTVASSAITTTSGDLTVCGLGEYVGGTWTQGTGYTIPANGTATNSSQETAFEYKLSSGTSESPGGTYSATSALLAVAMAFTESGGGGGDTGWGMRLAGQRNRHIA